jgi:hypothetical protein
MLEEIYGKKDWMGADVIENVDSLILVRRK